MKKNIGAVDSFVRVALGLVILGCGTVRKCFCSIIIGALITASGVARFCPCIYMAEVKTKLCPCSKQKTEP